MVDVLSAVREVLDLKTAVWFLKESLGAHGVLRRRSCPVNFAFFISTVRQSRLQRRRIRRCSDVSGCDVSLPSAPGDIQPVYHPQCRWNTGTERGRRPLARS